MREDEASEKRKRKETVESDGEPATGVRRSIYFDPKKLGDVDEIDEIPNYKPGSK